MFRRLNGLIAGLVLLISAPVVMAQQVARVEAASTADITKGKTTVSKPDPKSVGVETPAAVVDEAKAGDASIKTVIPVTPAPQSSNECGICRWFELQTATVIALYRYQASDKGIVTTNQLQHKEVFKASFKFDREGKFAITAGASSGASFIGSYLNTGLGRGVPASNLRLRELYLAVKPLNGIEVQAGGLYLIKGESTEATSYDDDGYIVGYRASIKRPQRLFFDEIAITYAYLGDTQTPNLIRRFHRMGQSNYHQFFVAKGLGKRASLSADYTFQSGTETLREAIRVNTKELRVLDSVRFENYQRLDVKRAFGFALRGEKTVQRFTVSGGFARIDRNYGSLGADRFGPGKRLFVLGSFKLNPDLSFNAFVGRAVANSFTIPCRTRMDVFFTYNLLKPLQRAGIF